MRSCKEWELARQAFEAFHGINIGASEWDAMSKHEQTKWLCSALVVASTLGVEKLVEMTPPCRVDARLRPEKPFPRDFIDEAAKRIAKWWS
jgi:hypothetical protein